VCYHKTIPDKMKILKNSDTLDCKISSFDPQNNATTENTCECINILRPNDTLDPVYFPVRISEQKLQCLKSIDPNLCDWYVNSIWCESALSQKVLLKNIKQASDNLNDSIQKFYFNRWICPNESWLNVAVRFNKDPA